MSDVSPQSIDDTVAQAVARSGRKGQVWWSQAEEIRAARARGKGHSAIAEQFCVSLSTVIDACDESGTHTMSSRPGEAVKETWTPAPAMRATGEIRKAPKGHRPVILGKGMDYEVLHRLSLYEATERCRELMERLADLYVKRDPSKEQEMDDLRLQIRQLTDLIRQLKAEGRVVGEAQSIIKIDKELSESDKHELEARFKALQGRHRPTVLPDDPPPLVNLAVPESQLDYISKLHQMGAISTESFREYLDYEVEFLRSHIGPAIIPTNTVAVLDEERKGLLVRR